MEQRIYQGGGVSAEGLAQALIDEWDRDTTVAQGFGDDQMLIVQIGHRRDGWLSDEPRHAITLEIQPVREGLQVTMGQQRWYQGDTKVMIGGLLGFFPFFFTFPLGELFGGSEEVDAGLVSRIWQSVERYAAPMQAAPTLPSKELHDMALQSAPQALNPQSIVPPPPASPAQPATGATIRLATRPCLRCGVSNPVTAEWCSACGAHLAEQQPRFCNQCGHRNEYNARFCNQCGTAMPGQ